MPEELRNDGLFSTAMVQFHRAADLIELDETSRALLSQPKNEIIVNFPVRMDHGGYEMFRGYRIQHDNTLGPYKGGIRYHPDVHLDGMKGLAAWMTWKTALCDLPFGGAAGGVACDPADHSRAELARITRRYTYALGANIGPEVDVPAPDLGTDASTMVWMMDTYAASQTDSLSARRVVTGKTVECGGTVGRDRAAGQGAVAVLDRWADRNGYQLEGMSASVQGWGKVGATLGRLLKLRGVTIRAVSDHTGTILDENGIDPFDLSNWVEDHGGVGGYPWADTIDDGAFWDVPVQLCFPSAIEHQITAPIAERMQAKVVVEAANGPTTAAADRILAQRGIEVLPDILVNAGGVIVSYFEWLQNRTAEQWSSGTVDRRLHETIIAACDRAESVQVEFGCTLRDAAHVVALRRISTVYSQRGIWP